ncbi:MAG: hypothetical protein MO853_00340 [Candidatus Protistobacter heckmanni]|nr:hypothetical protein [Candidatus Protistobacter heckmanni]
MVKPVQLLYNIAAQRDDTGKNRTIAQFEYGLTKNLSGVGGVVTIPSTSSALPERYYNAGLRGFFSPYILTADFARQQQTGGSMSALGLNTRVGQFSLTANHVQLSNFTSDIYAAADDPIRIIDKFRLDGGISIGKDRLPVNFQLERDRLASGAQNYFVTGRVTGYFYGTSVTNELVGQSLAG